MEKERADEMEMEKEENAQKKEKIKESKIMETIGQQPHFLNPLSPGKGFGFATVVAMQMLIRELEKSRSQEGYKNGRVHVLALPSSVEPLNATSSSDD